MQPKSEVITLNSFLHNIYDTGVVLSSTVCGDGKVSHTLSIVGCRGWITDGYIVNINKAEARL